MKKFFLVLSMVFSSLVFAGETKMISAKEVEKLQKGTFHLVDVRTKEEYDDVHIKDAKLLTLGSIESSVLKAIPNKDEKIVLYCRSGNRSAQAFEKLKKLGYTNVHDLGSIKNWEDEKTLIKK